MSSQPRVTSQKADITRRFLEARPLSLGGLAGSDWGAVETKLRTATLDLVHSTDYCAPAWCRINRTRHIDPVIKDALRTVTGCLRPTPANNLPILAGNQLAELRRKGATPCHEAWTSALVKAHLSTGWGCAASRIETPICTSRTTTQQLSDNIRSAALWVDNRGNAERLENTTRLRTFIPVICTHPPRMALPRTALFRLDRLRTGVGRFRSCLHKWGMTPSVACECGAEQQTVDHVLHCAIHRPLHGVHGLTILDDWTIEWLAS